MIFLGPFINPEEEKEILNKSKNGISNAANKFQWDILCGFISCGYNLKIINVLPVGIYFLNYKDFWLKSKEWVFNGIKVREIGCLNFPFIKQYFRYAKIRKLLKAKDYINEKEILIYSTYLPFLKAINKLDASYQIILIVTDLPEYYDLNQANRFRKLMRKLYNKRIYKLLNRIDKYIILTEEMKKRLPIYDKPYVVVEGIYSEDKLKVRKENIKKEAIEKEIILYTGSLHYRFGIKTLIEAFSEINNKECELWICGTGEASEEIKKFEKENNKIKYWGFVSSVKAKDLQEEATILINPRTNHGEYTKYSFPSKTISYLSSGTPLIAYKLDGIPKEYDKHIYYVKDDTVSGLSDTINQVLDIPSKQRFEKAEKARKFICNEKNAEVQVRKIINVLAFDEYQAEKEN